jgi:hypothetical protein
MTQTETNPAATSTAVTLDLYREVHKGLRHALFALCEAAGSLDAADPAARAAFVTQFAVVDNMLRLHHGHEDGEHFGGLIARAAPQFTAELEVGHDKSVADLAELRAAVIALGDGGTGADELYDMVAAFVVDYLGHMAVEEHQVMPALSAATTFDDLLDVQIALRTSMPPTDMVMFMRMMLPAMNPDERTNMLGGMKAGAPPEIFAVFWAAAKEVLSPAQLAVVAQRIGA